MSSTKSKEKLEEELKNDEQLAAWHACLQIEQAFRSPHGDLDLRAMMQASFHAGMAIALYKVRCKL